MLRKAHQPTDTLRHAVAEMIAIGLQQRQVARILGLDAKTLVKHYKKDLEHGLARVVAEVGRSLIAKAREGDRRAMEFFLRARAGWKQDDPTITVNANAEAKTVSPVLVGPGAITTAEWMEASKRVHAMQNDFHDHRMANRAEFAAESGAAQPSAAQERLREAEAKFARVVAMQDPIQRRKIERAERVSKAIADGTGRLDDY